MRHVVVAFALMICNCVVAQDASLVGAWQLQTPQLWQQLELNNDGTYQRSIVTAGSRRTEIGRWRSDISLLVLQADHVITTQGARVPLPPREKQIDVAGVDANSLTLYYDGDALETWQRQVQAATLPQRPIPTAIASAPLAAQQLPRSRPCTITMPVPRVTLVAVQIELPAMPDLVIAPVSRTQPSVDYEPAAVAMVNPEQLAVPVVTIAPDESAVSVQQPVSAVTPALPMAAPAGIYPEAPVVELITQIACEELRYPQRDRVASARHYQELAARLGLASVDPSRLQRTLRYYQSNADFLRTHQQAIAENSLRCVMQREQVSVVP